MSKTNPADTLAALAPCPFCGGAARLCEPTCDKSTPYKASHRAFPVVRCNCGAEVAGRDWDQRGTSAIAAWNRRASLKGEAVLFGWVAPSAGQYFRPADIAATERTRELIAQGELVRVYTAPPPQQAAEIPLLSWWCPRCGGVEVSRERRPNGNATCENGHTYPMRETIRAHKRPTIATQPTPPPDPQAVGEAINWPLVREGLDYFDRAGDAGDKLYVAEIRKALGQPSPAPQGGGEADGPLNEGDLSLALRAAQAMRECADSPANGETLTPEGFRAYSALMLRLRAHILATTRTGDDVRFAAENLSATPPAQQPGEVGSCEWHQQDEGGDYISTGCGNEFVLNDASDYEDGKPALPFCPYCAKPTVFNHWHDEDEEADTALAPKEKGNG